MLLMLGSPICLYLMAYIRFPEQDENIALDQYYFERAKLLWPLGGLTVIVGTLFRSIAFGDSLWVVDHASRIPILVVGAILTLTRNRVAHRALDDPKETFRTDQFQSDTILHLHTKKII